jgi:hypothetical protein
MSDSSRAVANLALRAPAIARETLAPLDLKGGAAGHRIRYACAGDGPAIASLINRAFGRDRNYRPRDHDWWRWKYAANPAGALSLVLEDELGRVVGHNGGVVREIIAGDAEYRMVQVCDACIDPDVARGLRRVSLFVRISRSHGVTLSGGEAHASYGLPVPGHYDLGARMSEYWMLRTQPVLTCTHTARLPADPASLETIYLHDLPADVDAFAKEVQASYACAGRRNAEFLRWRFLHAPEQSYHGALARERQSGATRGIAIYRAAEFLGRRVGVLVDWIVPAGDVEAGASLLRWCAGRAQDDRVRELIFLCPLSSPWSARFQRFGFAVEPTEYVMTLRPYDQALEPEWMRRNWHYTAADFDVL